MDVNAEIESLKQQVSLYKAAFQAYSSRRIMSLANQFRNKMTYAEKKLQALQASQVAG